MVCAPDSPQTSPQAEKVAARPPASAWVPGGAQPLPPSAEPGQGAPSLTPTHTSGRHVTPTRASRQHIVQSAWAPSSAHLPEGLPCHLQAECHAENPHWFKNCLFFEMQNDTSKYYTTKRYVAVGTFPCKHLTAVPGSNVTGIV